MRHSLWRAMAIASASAAPGLAWKMTGEPVESAAGIAFEWTFGGTNTGDWGAGDAGDRQGVQLDGVTFMRIEDGKIVYQGDYYDGLGFQKQLG